MGRQHFWFAAEPLTNPDPRSDRWSVENGLVSLTPLRLDLTDRDSLRSMGSSPTDIALEVDSAYLG